MRKLIALSLALMAVCSSANAESTQTVIVDGATVNKNVTLLTFSGDDVVITFDDNASQTVDMSLLSISFAYTETGINDVEKNDGADVVKKVYNLNGQYMGNSTAGLPKGLYIVNGKKMVIK